MWSVSPFHICFDITFDCIKWLAWGTSARCRGQLASLLNIALLHKHYCAYYEPALNEISCNENCVKSCNLSMIFPKERRRPFASGSIFWPFGHLCYSLIPTCTVVAIPHNDEGPSSHVIWCLWLFCFLHVSVSCCLFAHVGCSLCQGECTKTGPAIHLFCWDSKRLVSLQWDGAARNKHHNGTVVSGPGLQLCYSQ